MQENTKPDADKKERLPDEDGTVIVYGFVQITDKNTGRVLVSTRA